MVTTRSAAKRVEEEEKKEAETEEEASNERFYPNISLLMLLYLLQGIPLGITGAIPTILQGLGVTYHEQALFSFAFWPFSLKLLWAPIIDTIYIKSLGLRKTWIFSSQLLLGVMMLYLSKNVDELLVNRQTYVLTFLFVALNFFVTTQDIAVDGWALTILPKKYVGWTSTCDVVGQTAGYFIGNVLLLTLESSHFANTYIRSTPAEGGFITLSGFLLFWGVVALFSSVIVCSFKKEVEFAEQNTSILQSYKELYRICCLPTVQSYLLLLLTGKIGYAAGEEVTGLKLIEAGFTRDQMALLAVPLTPVQLLLPIAISRISSGPRPLMAAFESGFYRLIFASCFPFLVYWTHTFGGEFPVYYYLVVVLLFCVHQVFAYGVFVNQTAFHAKVSDPRLGGTYMTLLNTFGNLGGNWPITVALWLVDDLTYKRKASDGSDKMVTIVDGYYVECVLCLIIGLVWLKIVRTRYETVQNADTAAWRKWRKN